MVDLPEEGLGGKGGTAPEQRGSFPSTFLASKYVSLLPHWEQEGVPSDLNTSNLWAIVWMKEKRPLIRSLRLSPSLSLEHCFLLLRYFGLVGL